MAQETSAQFCNCLQKLMKSTALPSLTETRVCKKCNTEKPIEEFPFAGGYRRWGCKKCKYSHKAGLHKARLLVDKEYRLKCRKKTKKIYR